MKYPLTVSGLDTRQESGTHQSAYSHGTESRANVPVVRRFPPVLQFLTRPESYVEVQLQTAAVHAFKEGRRVDQICGAIYHTALSLGYHVTIGVQEIFSSSMPSFPNETVMSALLMIDCTELRTGIDAPAMGYS